MGLLRFDFMSLGVKGSRPWTVQRALPLNRAYAFH
jgi:hypothetical protein